MITRSIHLLRMALFASALAPLASLAADAPTPILDGFTADPSIHVFGDTYYVYPTSDKPNWQTTDFSVWSSKNLVDWKKEGMILDVTKDLKWANIEAWAPDCIERNGTYYFYFCAKGKVGVAKAKSPTGPFVDALGKPLLTKTGKVRTNTIDPQAFIDHDGQAYLYFGNGNGFAQVFKLKPDMITLDGDPVDIPLKEFREGICVFKRQGKYYFMWSIDDARSPNYRVGYGTADTPFGPVTSPAEYVVLRKNGIAVGTAHHSVVNVPGTDRWYTAYHRHAIPDGGGYKRETCLARMNFNVDGTIQPINPLGPAFKAGDIGEPITQGKGLSELTSPAPIPFTPSNPTFTVEADQAIAKVSPLHYGMMTEEINHCYDGGLYAELIQNRTFQDDPVNPVHWSVLQQDGAIANIALDRDRPLNSDLPVSLRLDVTKASGNQRAAIANDGYWGIPVKSDTRYRANFRALAGANFNGAVTMSIESEDGATVYAKTEVSKLTDKWQNYTAILTTGKLTPTTRARLVISVNRPGSVWFNLVSLFPPTWNDRPNGNRIDLMQLMADMKPAFLRFPGGNYLQGNTVEDRYPWKKTLGPLAQRPGHMGPWGYRSSDGMGLLEFLLWCEDLKVEPILGVYAGYSLPTPANGQRGTPTLPGAALQPFVEEALDEIEYITGDVTTRWGAQRAKDGHPEPFKLTYIEIGNEDWFDKSDGYDGRYTQFVDALKAKHPQLQFISSIGNEQPANKRVRSRKPDLLDEHYYLPADKFEKNSPTHFDSYDRKGPRIFVGEWAAHETAFPPWDKRSADAAPTPNMKAALGDAAWMAAMERNSDLVTMQCYAPLFVNVNPGARQWRPNLIGYDALNSYGSPSYYAIQMFSRYHGDTILKASFGNPPANSDPLQYTVTKDSKTGTIFIKTVNFKNTAQTINLSIKSATRLAPTGTAVTLAASLTDTNSLAEPNKVIPVTSKVANAGTNMSYTFAPNSITVLQLDPQ